MPQWFKEAGYTSLSLGKVFHQGLDDDLAWTPQSEWPDNYTRGEADNKGKWKTRRWRYEQWLDPRNSECGAKRHGVVSAGQEGGGATCATEEHYDRAPHSAYQDYQTATLARRTIEKLALDSNPRFKARGGRVPWFLAVGFVRPHLPFTCPGAYWAGGKAKAGDPADPIERLGPGYTMRRPMKGGEPGPRILGQNVARDVVFGPGSSRALVKLAGSAETGFGEFRDFLPPGVRTIPSFNDPEGTFPSVEGAELPVAPLRAASAQGYRACVSFVDAQVGRVLKALDESGQRNKTVTGLGPIGQRGYPTGKGLWT